MKIPRPIPIPRFVQEEHEPSPGHCLDPFDPFLGFDGRTGSDLADTLYCLADDLWHNYNDGDVIEELDGFAHKIRCNLCSWYEIGLKAWKIKLFKAWKNQFSSFKDFCEKAIGRTASAVNNWIRAARVMSQLIAAGFDRLPLTASVALELSRFSREDLTEAWGWLTAEYADHELTLEKVKAYLVDPLGKDPIWKTMRIPVELWQKLQKRSKELEIPVSELIEGLLGGGEKTDESEESDEPDTVAFDKDNLLADYMTDGRLTGEQVGKAIDEHGPDRVQEALEPLRESGIVGYFCPECNTLSAREVPVAGRKQPIERCDCCGWEPETPNFAHRYRTGFAIGVPDQLVKIGDQIFVLKPGTPLDRQWEPVPY